MQLKLERLFRETLYFSSYEVAESRTGSEPETEVKEIFHGHALHCADCRVMNAFCVDFKLLLCNAVLTCKQTFQRHGFEPESVYVGFVVGKVALV
jgi:hypothetical protein